MQHCRPTLVHATPGVNVPVSRCHDGTSNPNRAGKGGETIEDIYKQLPPRGKPDCVTHLSTNETIDEAISRITTSEGMYKMYWMLVQKAQNADQGTDHKKTLSQKV